MDGPEFKGSIFEEFGRVAAAFGSSKRVEISDLLAQGERTVESIASATGMMLANAERLAVGPPQWPTNPSRQERQRRTHACQRHAQGCNRAGVRNLHGCPGLTDTELVKGAARSTLDELTEMTVNANKVLVF